MIRKHQTEALKRTAHELLLEMNADKEATHVGFNAFTALLADNTPVQVQVVVTRDQAEFLELGQMVRLCAHKTGNNNSDKKKQPR